MKCTILTAAAVLLPGVLAAQTPPRADTAARTPPSATRTNTAAAAEAAAAQPRESEMTPAMRAAQNNPRIVGSPAWWLRHSTADGQPRRPGDAAAPAPPPSAIPAPTTPPATRPPR